MNKINHLDPFGETIVESEFFTIDMTHDTVIRGSQGTLMIFQKGCIMDRNANIIKGMATVELSEALKIDDMIYSNLTTTSNGELLETGGMIYINVYRNDEQLYINPAKPVYIELPSKNRKSNMFIYEGRRDNNGNMDWINPEPIENHLNPVDIFALDLLPDGFEEAVEKEIPFRNHETATKALVDSLYYSLHFTEIEELIPETIMTNLDAREAFQNNSFPENELDSLLSRDVNNNVTHYLYGVDPAIIKTLITDEFQNTLIATKEFRERLQVMFKICRTDMVDIYIRNLNKNLWELDSIAASILDDNIYQEDFKNFAAQKWTTVKATDVDTELLKEFYKRNLIEIKAELVAHRNKAVSAQNEKGLKAEKIVADYQSLINKREAYRMTGYGFQRTTLGWINIDRGIQSKSWEYQPFEIILKNSKSYDRTYAYIILKGIKSLYRLNSNDQKTFYVGNSQRREMITPKGIEATAIIISYKNDSMFFASKEYHTGTIRKLTFDSTHRISEDELRIKLSQFENYSPENSVFKDLYYLDQIYKEEVRQDKLEHEQLVMSRLKSVAYPLDSSFFRFNRKFQIDMPVDTCTNSVKALTSISKVN